MLVCLRNICEKGLADIELFVLDIDLCYTEIILQRLASLKHFIFFC